jgi:hypothetical protein
MCKALGSISNTATNEWTKNSHHLLIILLSLIISYALQVIYIYSICIMEILHNGVLLLYLFLTLCLETSCWKLKTNHNESITPQKLANVTIQGFICCFVRCLATLKKITSGLMPIILATQEAEIRRIAVWGQSGQIVHETLPQKKPSQKRTGGVAQGVGPEFKLQFKKKKKELKNVDNTD